MIAVAASSRKSWRAIWSNKWAVTGLLFLSAALNYGDRTAMSAIFPLLQRDLGMSDVELALTGSFFLWSYATASLLAGYLGDRYSRSSLVTVSVLAWSLAMAASALATSSAGLLGMRLLLGIAESLYLPAAVGLLADYHGKETRATALGFHTGGYGVGMVCGGVLAGYLGSRYGWRVSIGVLGMTGVLLSGVFALTIRNGCSSETAGAQARPPAFLPALAHILRIPSCVFLIVQSFLVSSAVWALNTWLPMYFLEMFHMDLTKAALTGTFWSNLGATVGVVIGGIPSDRLARRGSRYRMLLDGCLLLAACPFLLAFAWSRSLTLAITALLTFNFLRSLGLCNEPALFTELLPPRLRSTAIGAFNFSNCVAGGFGIVLAGYLKSDFGLAAVFGTGAILVGIASLMLVAGFLLFAGSDLKRAEDAMADQVPAS